MNKQIELYWIQNKNSFDDENELLDELHFVKCHPDVFCLISPEYYYEQAKTRR